jgi:phosphoserine phosphatase
VKNIKKQRHPSKDQTLISWADQINAENQSFEALFFDGEQFSISNDSTYLPPFNLIVMGTMFNAESFLLLLNLIAEKNQDKISVHRPVEIEKITAIRLSFHVMSSDLKIQLNLFCQAHLLDFALPPQFPDFTKPGLVLMDMDSTTIQMECIDEIARLYGVGEQISAVTALAMQGKLDFNESLFTRVGKLKNMPVSILDEVGEKIPLMPGLIELLACLKKANWKVAIASGGFTYFADKLKAELGFDAAYACTLEILNEKLTGKLVGEIVNAQVKADKLQMLAKEYNLPLSQTVAIGDGANDLLMMQAAAMGIAIHAKPIVQEKADISINHLDLQGAMIILSIATLDAWNNK